MLRLPPLPPASSRPGSSCGSARSSASPFPSGRGSSASSRIGSKESTSSPFPPGRGSLAPSRGGSKETTCRYPSKSSCTASTRSSSPSTAEGRPSRSSQAGFLGLWDQTGDFDVLYDVFMKMDRTESHRIGRADYTWGMQMLGGDTRSRAVLGRVNLRGYFDKTEEDMDIETFFRRALPSADDATINEHMRWVRWRRARVLASKLSASEAKVCDVHACFALSPKEDLAWSELEESGLLRLTDMNYRVEKWFEHRDTVHLCFGDFVEAILMKYWHPLEKPSPEEMSYLCQMGLDRLAAAKGIDLRRTQEMRYKAWRQSAGGNILPPVEASVMERMQTYIEREFNAQDVLSE